MIYIALLLISMTSLAKECTPAELQSIKKTESKIFRCESLMFGETKRVAVLKEYETADDNGAGISFEVYDGEKLVQSISGLGETLLQMREGKKEINSIVDITKDRARVIFLTFVPPQVGALNQIEISKDRVGEIVAGGAEPSSLHGKVQVSAKSIEIPQDNKTKKTVPRLK